MRVLVFTWNTHGHSTIPEIPSASDLILISLQECCYISNLKEITKGFNSIKTTSMFGLKTIVLSREGIETESFRIGQGLFGFVNKGFIATKIHWRNHRIIHINAHLSAHSWNKKKRGEQLEEILSFVNEQDSSTVIISGDLNFRNEKNGFYKDDEGECFKKKYKIIMEAPLKFKPSYKFNKDAYDETRIPSYCDRVMVGSTGEINFIEYQSMNEITDSDHKPVFCRFEIAGNTLGKVSFGKLTKKRDFVLKRIWTRIVLFFLERKVRLLVMLFVFSMMIISKTYSKSYDTISSVN